MSDLTLTDMLALRRKPDPDAPDMIVFPEGPDAIATMLEGVESHMERGASLDEALPMAETAGSSPASIPKWRVVYDGPSRPIIESPDGRLLSLSQFGDGRWQSYEQEAADADAFVKAMNRVHRIENPTILPIGQYALCPLCGGSNTGRWTHERGTPFLGCYDCGCCAPETEWQKGRVE